MNEKEEIRHSKWNMASYGAGSGAREFINMAFSSVVYFYYESVIGLNSAIVALAFIFFAIYNMFNDPILGYLIERPFKFTRKWGRRFPWLMMSGIPLGLSYIIVFWPPIFDPISEEWALFAWLLFTSCLFDTFHSLFFVSYLSLFPEKFQSDRERRLASGIYIPIGVIGVALGAMVPPLIFKYPGTAPHDQVLMSFLVQGVVVALICIIGVLLAIPGYKEDPDTVERYLAIMEKKPKEESFFKTLWKALKQKSFIVYMVIYTMYQSQITTMQSSIHYAVNFVIPPPPGISKNLMATLIFAAFLIGVIASTPFWVKMSHKVNNNKKIMLTASIFLGIFILPLLFIREYFAVVLIMLIWGVPLGGYWLMIFPVMSDVIDEATLIHGKPKEAIYSGFSQFFGRLGIVAQALTFGIVHALTGFKEGASTQTPLAQFGIQIHLALVPAIFILIGAFIFWKFYKLTPEKIRENQVKLKEMGLK